MAAPCRTISTSWRCRRPSTVEAAALALRHLAEHIIETFPECTSVATIERRHIESYKLALAASPASAPTSSAPRPSATTWAWPAHSSSASSTGTTPTPPVGSHPGRRLAQGGRADAQVPGRSHCGQVHGRPGHRPEPPATTHRRVAGPHRHACRRTGWARRRRHVPHRRHVLAAHPLGKLHNDRSVPLHPMLVGLINDYRAWRGPIDTGIGSVHPHSCATPWPPNASTGGCRWRPPRRCWDTAPLA